MLADLSTQISECTNQKSNHLAKQLSKLIPAILPHLQDKLGFRSVDLFWSSNVVVGAAGSAAKFLFNLSQCSSTVEHVVNSGAVLVVVDQLRNGGPLIRPRSNSKQVFV